MVVEIHEDLPLMEPGAAWPRQIWATAQPEADGYSATRIPCNLMTNHTGAMIFKLLNDFTSFTSAHLVLYGGGTRDFELRIRVSGGAYGESPLNHTQVDTRDHALTLGVFSYIDLIALLPAVFGALSAEDHVLVTVRNQNGLDITVYGIDVRYT